MIIFQVNLLSVPTATTLQKVRENTKRLRAEFKTKFGCWSIMGAGVLTDLGHEIQNLVRSLSNFCPKLSVGTTQSRPAPTFVSVVFRNESSFRNDSFVAPNYTLLYYNIIREYAIINYISLTVDCC